MFANWLNRLFAATWRLGLPTVRPDQHDQVTIRTPDASRTLDIIQPERE